TLTIRLNRARALHSNAQRADAWRELNEAAAKYEAAQPNPAQRYEVEFIRGQMLLDEGNRAGAIDALTKAINGWRENKSNPQRVKMIEQLIDANKLVQGS
ncbi:MAG: hypothetical protein ACRCWJ_10425, partial [Casimicrobium sp.]